jgi:hypothetical protein
MTTRLTQRLASQLPRLLAAPEPPPLWPRFRGPLHVPAVTARIGRVLGICFGTCFITGLLSAYQYSPWAWLPPLAAPAWGYRLTQGLHVATGIASIPLLLVKLWSVYPRLFAWPPARSLVQALERLSVAVLVASALVELGTGLLNTLGWYAWPWSFRFVHHQLAYVVIGSVLLHIAVKLPVIREALATPLAPASPQGAHRQQVGGLSRRGLITATGVGVGAVAATTAGQSLTPLRPVALLAPRRVDDGPLGVPINRTYAQAGVLDADVGPSWRLRVTGPTPFHLDLGELEALAAVEHRLPLACVEGWSVSATWRGPMLMDLVRRAGGDEGSLVRVTSAQQHGAFRSSTLYGGQLHGAVLATHLNGTRITRDHGYPVRVIAPGRPGVFNTKWLTGVEVS